MFVVLSFGVIIRQRQVANILSDMDHGLQCFFFFFNKYLFGRAGSGPRVESSSLTKDRTGPPVLRTRNLSHWPPVSPYNKFAVTWETT